MTEVDSRTKMTPVWRVYSTPGVGVRDSDLVSGESDTRTSFGTTSSDPEFLPTARVKIRVYSCRIPWGREVGAEVEPWILMGSP